MHELSAHEVAKAGASSLSKLALSAGVRRGSSAREGYVLRKGGGMNLYWFTSQPI